MKTIVLGLIKDALIFIPEKDKQNAALQMLIKFAQALADALDKGVNEADITIPSTGNQVFDGIMILLPSFIRLMTDKKAASADLKVVIDWAQSIITEVATDILPPALLKAVASLSAAKTIIASSTSPAIQQEIMPHLATVQTGLDEQVANIKAGGNKAAA